MTIRTQADPLAVLRRRTSEKWRAHSDDVLPMFVAEMDFPLAPAIRAALHDAVDLGDTGYVAQHDRRAAVAFAEYARDTWSWPVSAETVVTTTDVSVVVVESLRRLIRPGEGVIITPPVYPPFSEMITEAGGTVVSVPLLDDGAQIRLDLDGIDRALATGTARGLLLCNPHNPNGLVHDRTTLTALSEVVARHGGFVLSDEIHAPLTHDPTAFVPYLTVSPAARAHGIAAHSGSKAFNLAGLKCAFFVTDFPALDTLVAELPMEVTVRTGLFGLIATQQGFAHGRDWLAGTIAAVQDNLDLLEQLLAERLPTVRLRRPRASYLAWLDFSALEWSEPPAEHLLRTARVALAEGAAFGAGGAGHARMNLGCHPDTVREAIDRIVRHSL